MDEKPHSHADVMGPKRHDGTRDSTYSDLRADLDPDLLGREEFRAVRLQIEYMKSELAFVEQGVDQTVVIFGSTRLEEPEVAAKKLEKAIREGDENGLAAKRARIAVERSHYYEVGRELGRIVGQFGQGPRDNRLIIATGGGPGGMEAANRGAFDVGAASAGLNITLPREQASNPYLTPELSLHFRYFALRKLHFMLRARALVALPGGYGTFDELFEVLCLVQTGKRTPLPIILVGEDFWRRAVDFDFLLAEGMIEPQDLALVQFSETAEDAWQRILRWYENRNESVFRHKRPSPSRRVDP